MNHDVFISYSSKRSAVANEICALLENSGLKCWIAPRDIVGNNYDDLIDEAIVSCKLFVFVFSQESSVSTWCKAELNLAFSENKAILPYRIDNTPLRGGFRLKLQMSHWLDASLDYRSEFPKLVQMATQIVGVPAPQPTPEPQQPQPEPKPQPKPQPTTKTYKVGDLYDDGTKKGVVFEVSPDGKHGKIVSLEETELPWAKDNQKVGTSDFGLWTNINMQAVQNIRDWREKYPAFAWCANLGEDWYLPTTTELSDLFEIKDVVNEELERQGAKKILGAPFVTWSSTEFNATVAWGVTVRDGITFDYKDIKLNLHHVRAVAKF